MERRAKEIYFLTFLYNRVQAFKLMSHDMIYVLYSKSKPNYTNKKEDTSTQRQLIRFFVIPVALLSRGGHAAQ